MGRGDGVQRERGERWTVTTRPSMLNDTHVLLRQGDVLPESLAGLQRCADTRLSLDCLCQHDYNAIIKANESHSLTHAQ